MGDRLVSRKYPQMKQRENKRRQMVYYSCNCSPRREEKEQGREKTDEEKIAWNFPKLKNDIKAKVQEPPGTPKQDKYKENHKQAVHSKN